MLVQMTLQQCVRHRAVGLRNLSLSLNHHLNLINLLLERFIFRSLNLCTWSNFSVENVTRWRFIMRVFSKYLLRLCLPLCGQGVEKVPQLEGKCAWKV